jgi:alkylhydroperoxidase family enzyme
VRREDHRPLRDVGLHDRGILEVVEVTAYFNYVNRLADGLGVSFEGEHE